ncbi:MAG: STAS domain-containing protein [Solirubrobacteraceae bacterium]
MQSDYRLESNNRDETAIVTIVGEVDLATAGALEQQVDRAAKSGARRVILDLTGVEFMDSTGLSVIVKAARRCDQEGQEFGLIRGPHQVQRLLSLTGIDERLRVADSLHELLGDKSPEN